jgi:hypothetical protein
MSKSLYIVFSIVIVLLVATVIVANFSSLSRLESTSRFSNGVRSGKV